MKAINILLAEDDQLDVIDMRRTLDKLGIWYHLIHAKNGAEALDMLNSADEKGEATVPDIALLDINMPKINGLELLEQIRSSERWKHLKCFIITTSSEPKDKASAEALGISGYIVKPLKANRQSNTDFFNLAVDLMNMKKE